MNTKKNVTTATLAALDMDDIKQFTHKYVSDSALFDKFVDNYYQNTQQHFGQGADKPLTSETLAGIALNHFSLLQRHRLGTPQVAVFNPDYESQHFHSVHSIIQIVASDRPFLVDTLLMSLESMNITVHRLHHTIMAVSRDDAQQVIDVSVSQSSDTKFISLIYCEISQQSADRLAEIQTAILDKIKVLDKVVNDWQAMRQKLIDVKQQLATSQLPAQQQAEIPEIQAFLDWILDNNFIFLGYREYHYRDEADGIEIYQQTQTGLGLLGDDHDNKTADMQAASTQNLDHEKPSESFNQLPKTLRALVNEPQVLLLSKSRHLSPVHRPAYMDFLGIQQFDDNRKVIGEHRFVGLLTANAYQLSVTQIPMLRQKVASVLAMAHLPTNGHAYHKFQHILNTLPRDDLFQASSEALYPMVMGIANLHNKHRLRLFARIDHYQRFVSCLIFVPRDKFNTQLRRAIQQILLDAFGGESSQFKVDFDELHHVRLHVHVRTQPENLNHIDIDSLLPSLEEQLNKSMQGWEDEARQVFADELGEAQGTKLADNYLRNIPLAYQEDYTPRVALQDLKRLDSIATQQALPMRWYLYQKTNEPAQNLHLKVYGKSQPATLSHILPILENFGLNVISSQSYELENLDLWMQAYALQLKHSTDAANLDMAVVAKQVEEGLGLIWQGAIENDSLNELILTTPLDAHEVVLLRALSHYMLQAKAPFSLPYIKQTLIRYPQLCISFVQLFHAKMRPQDVVLASEVMSDPTLTVENIEATIQDTLKSVQTLDEDRILRWILDLMHALLRTNYYQRDEQGERKDRLSFKFSAKDIPNLPKPKPMFEIFVYSPKVEAVHLRGGKVARGGLRWSDRMEDFRTEVLGLVKAQMVKNAVIVPVGSKGAFIVKTKSMKDGRETYMAEGVRCYQTFIRGLLDITDNLVDGHVVPPANTLRHDGDDPYLVVAADKGTATFSDIANALSAEYGFWLGDAFASGGSVGYDHKAMGITARGAWESVKRHFRMMGKDIQNPNNPTNQFTVVGIGDMGGDVFGNGMLLSPNIKLLAAFNHLHIFIDPTPDVAAALSERERLFNLPRSTWDDYNKALISQGGGVFSRQDKAIAISSAMKQAFTIEADSLTPDELIHALLKSPVDLIWNGGIGTYVKSTQESHADVGDRANDAVRIDGHELQAKVIGEGGNLGMTQRGRIEFAQAGGRLYTDAIDNSAGVNCSDHEVNIKILLDGIVAQGDMTVKQRNELLASMTDDVAKLVLRQNYLQPQAIELSAMQATANLGLQQKFMQYLESEERLDRAIEFLPSDEEIARRQKAGQGLTNPELSVLLAYGKMWVYDHLLESDVPDDGYFIQEMRKYFPTVLSERYFEQMQQNPLHREIISTYLTNSLVNRLGIEDIYRMIDELGVSISSVVKSYSVMRDVFDISQYWQLFEALDNQIDSQHQLTLELCLRQDLTQSMYWLIQQFGEDFDVTSVSTQLSDGMASLSSQTFDNQPRTSYFRDYLDKLTAQYSDISLLQSHSATLPVSPQVLDAVWFAKKNSQDVKQVTKVYFKAYELLHIDWLLMQIEALPQTSYWERRAAHALREDIMTTFRRYVSQFLAQPDPLSAIEAFASQRGDTLAELVQAKEGDLPITFAILSVLVSQLKEGITD